MRLQKPGTDNRLLVCGVKSIHLKKGDFGIDGRLLFNARNNGVHLHISKYIFVKRPVFASAPPFRLYKLPIAAQPLGLKGLYKSAMDRRLAL
jgi:hypothetical protein